MTLDLSTYKVANAETSDANKFDNLLDAIQAAVVALQTAPSSPALATGDLVWAATRTRTGCLLCDGSAVSRATYPDLFTAIVPAVGAFTVTLASPGVFTLGGHGLVIGDRVYITTTGALPTGLAVNTIYYVVSTADANTFTLSATEGGSAINTSVSQSGVHTLHFCPFGLGDGSTTFNVPDGANRALVAAGGSSAGSLARALGQNDGVAVGNRQGLRHKHTPHVHAIQMWTGPVAAATIPQTTNGTPGSSQNTAAADGGSGVSTDPADGGAFLAAHLFIKT